MNTQSYKYKNTIVKGCARSDSLKVFASSSLLDKLIEYRKLITKTFNVRQGTHDSLLIMECNSNESAEKLKTKLFTLPIVNHAKLVYRVNLNAFVDGTSVYSDFTPGDFALKCDKANLTLSEFLYVTKSPKMIDTFMSKYDLKDEDNDKIQFGGAHITAMTDLCWYFRKYKDRLFVEMIKPKYF